MKLLSTLLLCLLSVPAFAQSPQADYDAAIRAVIESFRTAIIDKDKARFVALFLPGPVTWQPVTSDKHMSRVRENHPQAMKVRVDPESNHLSFIDHIVASPARAEETFRDIRIDSDGDIASVAFDYAFLADGRETNHGREAWQLVRTDAGWRIVAVIWSVNPAPPVTGP